MSLPPPSPTVHKTRPKSFYDFIFTAFNLYSTSPKPTTVTSSSSYNHHHRINFSTPQSLSDWLRPRLPSDSFAAWGTKPGTKNIYNLWLEIYEGETCLADSTPPVRTLQVVVVRIRDHNNRILIESHQELSNGDLRTRSRPLSEKMRPGETVEEAAVRAVTEELGSIVTLVQIVPDSYSTRVEEKLSSASYPGLPASYVLHTLDALVHGLPDFDFCTTEEEHNIKAQGAVSCKKHYWKWVDSNSL